MKQLALSLTFLCTLLLGTFTPSVGEAARPNPPTLAGTVPAVIVVGGTNSVVIPPRVLVIDERGNTVADVETTVDGLTGRFSIPLKKAGTYVVVGYYPEPNRMVTQPQAVEVFRKQTTTVTLAWQPQ